MNTKRITLLLIITLQLLSFMSCGKKSTIYEIELTGVKEELTKEFRAQEKFVKYQVVTAGILKVLHYPAYYAGSKIFKKSLARIYTKTYKDGSEAFNSMQEGYRYNYIINDDKIIFTKTGKHRGRDTYSKHVRLNSFNNKVRYAGEMWKIAPNQFQFNNGSGSYKPKSGPGVKAEVLLNKNFPHLNFEFIPFKDAKD